MSDWDTEQDKQLREYFSLVPSEFHSNTVIAGGAAQDLSRANDVDIWILNSKPIDITRFGSLSPFMWRIISQQEQLNYGAGVWGKLENSTAAHKPVQVMFTSILEPQFLVDSFDISVHAVAIGMFNSRTTAAFYTPPWEEPTNRQPGNLRSIQRLQALRLRYLPDRTKGFVE